MLLMIIVSVSAPVSNSISFLDVNINGRSIHFGEYGYTGTKRSIGYTIDETALGLSDTLLNLATIRSLTGALVLHTVAACVLFVAFLQGICAAVNYSRIHTVFMGMTMSLGLLFTTIAFAVDLILFNLIGERIRADGHTAHLGSATWMTLAALILALMGICAAGCGAFGYYDDDWDFGGYYNHRRRQRRRRSRSTSSYSY